LFGGNTSCLEIRAGKRLVIVDFGTGIKPLGDWLTAHDLKKGPLETDIFITHTHWDHIMGFPMFSPLFNPATKLRIRGPVLYEDETLESILGAQLSYRYWPIRLKDFSARIEYEQIKETSLDLGDGLRVSTKYLNHSILCLGYRFEYQGKSIVTAYDHEPFRNLFPTDPAEPGYNEHAAREGELAAREESEKLLRFFDGADVLIHDTQYTAREYEANKQDWGHSSYEHAVNSAAQAGVKRLVFFHHDTSRTDKQLARLEEKYRRQFKAPRYPALLMAREGLTVKA
jgi:ribonuclease BN (tRNA processing enzyme)